MEAGTARALAAHLREVEDRLRRLVVSGWRQAGPEAAELRHDADALAEAGLAEVAARLRAVAEARDAAEALRAIALAVRACELLRVRLPLDDVPDGLEPFARPTRKGTGGTEGDVDTLLPVARMLLDGREVWACGHHHWGRQWLLLEPPFPVEDAAVSAAEPSTGSGVIGRLARRFGGVLGGGGAGGSVSPPAPWLHDQLRGVLVWQARYPLGVNGDVDLFTLDRPAWVSEPDTDRSGIRAFHHLLSSGVIVSGAMVFPSGGGFRLVELARAAAAGYVWLDPTAAAVFEAVPAEKVWTIAWLEGWAVVPVALIWRGQKRGDSHRLTHLIPGAPTDALAVCW